MSKVLKQFPPNYDIICKHLPAVKRQPSIVFTYGDTIYNPQGHNLRPDLLVHEEVHVQRQKNPEEWWSEYLTDVRFRLSEELEAYREQYIFIEANYNRSMRREILSSIAKDLSGPMYGNLISKKQAIELITERYNETSA